MNLKLKNNNRSILIIERTKELFNRLRSEGTQREKSDLRLSEERIFQAFKELYTTLGKPSVVLEPFEPKQVPRSAKINRTMQDIEKDLEIAYSESANLGRTFVEVFNYSLALSNELNNSAQSITSRVVDLKILEGQFDQNVLVAGDDFTDTSKIDTAFPIQNPSADISIAQGIATLNKVESINVARNNAEMRVQPVNPQDLKVIPTVDNVNRFYEGNFYNFVGSARPEGGKWHLEENITKSIEETGISTKVYASSKAWQHPQLAQQYLNSETKGGGSALAPEDIVVFDRGASEEEKDIIRAMMVDSNPSTFWECEYVKTYDKLQQSVEQSRKIQSEIEAGNIETFPGQDLKPVTIDDLRTEAALLTGPDISDDLQIEVTITLSSPQNINWVSINPNNFEETAWIEVTDISIAKDTNSIFETIPGFNNNIYDNTLTDQANAEITSEEATAILAPDRYRYRGIGVWSFEAVEARAVKIRLKQKIAVPNPYQRLAVRMHRLIQQTYTMTEADSMGI
jgi:hypothetical protein